MKIDDVKNWDDWLKYCDEVTDTKRRKINFILAFLISLLAIISISAIVVFADNLEFIEGAGIIGSGFVKSTDADSNFAHEIVVSEVQCRRAVIEWNLTTLPAGSTITTATLRLLFEEGKDANSDEIGIHELTGAVAHDTVTWNTWPAYNATAEDTITVVQDYVWHSIDVREMVERNVNGVLAIGMISTAESCGGDDYKSFTDELDATASDKPTLNITYTVPDIMLTIQSPTNTTYAASNVTMSFTASHQTDSIDSCWYVLNGGSNVSITGCANTTIIGTEQFNTLIIGVNTSNSDYGLASINFTIDTVAPNLTVQSPTNTTYTTTNISLLYTAGDSGLASCAYQLNGGTNFTIANCANTTFLATQNNNTIIVIATDNAGHQTQITVSFTVDSLPPSITIEAPINTTYISTPLNFTVDDSYGLGQCWYSLDGGASNTTITDCNNLSIIGYAGSNWLTVYVNDTLGNLNYTVINFTIRMIIDDCSGVNPITLNFTFYDEDGLNLTVADMDITLYYWLPTNMSFMQNISFAFTNDTSHAICIFPNATITVNATIQYKGFAELHPSRDYYLVNTEISNTTSLVKLYLIDDGVDVLTKFYVENADGVDQPDIVIEFQRYYVDSNTYRTVAMIKTDQDGLGITRLRPYDTFYKFIAARNGIVLDAWLPPIEIFPDPTTLVATITRTLTGGEIGQLYQYLGRVAFYCPYNDATTVISCTVTDTSGIVQSTTFLVQKLLIMGWETACTDTQTETGTTFTCTLGAGVNGTYRYSLTLHASEGDYLLANEYLDFTTASIYGTAGVFMALMLFLVMVFIGSYNPSVSIILGAFSLVISYMLGLITVGYGSLVGIIVVVAITAYRLRT